MKQNKSPDAQQAVPVARTWLAWVWHFCLVLDKLLLPGARGREAGTRVHLFHPCSLCRLPNRLVVMTGVCGGKRTLPGFHTFLIHFLASVGLLAWTMSCLLGEGQMRSLDLLDSPQIPMVWLRIFQLYKWCKIDTHSIETILRTLESDLFLC